MNELVDAVRRLVSAEHPSFQQTMPNLYRISRDYLTEFEALEEQERLQKIKKPLCTKPTKKSCSSTSGKVVKSKPDKPRKEEVESELAIKSGPIQSQTGRIAKQAKSAKSVTPTTVTESANPSAINLDSQSELLRIPIPNPILVVGTCHAQGQPEIYNVPGPLPRVAVKSASVPAKAQKSASIPAKSQNPAVKSVSAKPKPRTVQVAEEKKAEDFLCMVCSWKFPSDYILEQRNRHVNLCLDGKGAADIEQYRQDMRMLKKIDKEDEEDEEEEEEDNRPEKCHICSLSFLSCSDEFILEHTQECEENPYAKKTEEFAIPMKRPMISRREFRKSLKKLKENNDQPSPEPAEMLFPDICSPE